MRVLIATGIYPPESGGPATYAKLIEEELPKRGIETRVLPFKTVRSWPPLIRHFIYFFIVISQSRGCEIIYALDPVSVGLPAALAAMVMRKKFILRIAGDYAWEQGRQRFGVKDELEDFQTKKYGWQVELLRSVQRFVANRSQKIVVPSEYMRRIVSGWVSDQSKVETIYSSIHMPVAYDLPSSRPEGFLVVSGARRVPWKGIEAIESIVAQEKGWHFFLIDNLPHKEAMGWCKSADVFVLNSTYEGLSHWLIEAMALGTPVVATNVGGNPELIANGSEGVIIPPKDDEALREALKEVEAHPDEARLRAERAKERSLQFSIDVTIEKLVSLLKNI